MKKIWIIICVLVVLIGGGIGGFFVATNLSQEEKDAVNAYDDNYSKTINPEILKNPSEKSLSQYAENLGAVEEEYNKLKWKQKIKVNGKKKDLDKEISDTKDALGKIAGELDSEIDKIGSVTLDSKDSIEKCRSTYNGFSDTTKKMVTGKEKLIQAEVDYAILAIDSIPSIDLSDECKVSMETAEGAIKNVEANSDKSKITNLSKYEEADGSYQALLKQKDDLVGAGNCMAKGDLKQASKLLKSLPDDFSFGDFNVKKMKGYLKKYSEYADLSGEYEGHGVTFRNPGFNISDTGVAYATVKCCIDHKGKLSIKINGTIPAFTDFYTVFGRPWVRSKILDYNVSMNDFGSKKDDYVTVTLNKNSVDLSVNYFNKAYASGTCKKK